MTLGEKLRGARVENGLEIAELAARTKIGAKFLDAIESGRRDILPGGFFYKHWTLQYASALSLDPAEIQAEVDQILSAEAPVRLPGQDRCAVRDGALSAPNIRRGESGPRVLVSFGLLFAVMLGCSALYALWHGQEQAGEPSLPQSASPNVVSLAESKSAADASPAGKPESTGMRTARASALNVSTRRLSLSGHEGLGGLPSHVKTKKNPTAAARRAKRSRRASRSRTKPELRARATFN